MDIKTNSFHVLSQYLTKSKYYEKIEMFGWSLFMQVNLN